MIQYDPKKKKQQTVSPTSTVAKKNTPVTTQTAAPVVQPTTVQPTTAQPTTVQPTEVQHPGDYQSPYQAQLDSLYEQISNGKFEYNLNGDPLWEQALASTMAQGKTAMRDTMGQAAALTGGYSSSYAQTAGQQAYNQLIEAMMSQAPAFEQAARDRYDQSMSALYDQYALLQGREDSERERYLSDYDMWWQQQQAEQAQQNWQAEFDESKRQWDESVRYGSSGGSTYEVDSYMEGVVQRLVDDGVTIDELSLELASYYNDVDDDFVAFIWELMQNTSPSKSGKKGNQAVQDPRNPGMVHTPW